MEAHELTEKFKNTKQSKENLEEIISWCIENNNNINLQDKNQHYLYNMSIKYLMKYKIGNWNKNDASIIIHYLAKKFAWDLGIDENITIKILDETEYKQIHDDYSSAICVNNEDNTFNISYSPKVTENLLSNNHNKFLRGLQTIFHEIVHALQNSIIQKSNIQGVNSPKTKTSYIMALETIARKHSPDFYKKNYNKLLKENHAEKIGLQQAMETIKNYNQNLYQAYNQEVIQQRLDNYDKNFYDAKVSLKNDRTIDLLLEIDTLSSIYIENHPNIIKKFPILQVGYNLDGSKKNLQQLIIERNKMLINNKTPEKINELYEAIANHRNVLTGGLNGTKNELITLDNYIAKTGTDDEFVFNLIKYRLKHKTKMTPEQITEFMEKEYATAARTRQLKHKKELNQEKQDITNI